MYLNEGARDHMGGVHRMHVKLLATRQLEETLQKAFERSSMAFAKLTFAWRRRQ